MFTLEGKLTLKPVVEQGFGEIREEFLERLKRSVEGLLLTERDRRVNERRRRWSIRAPLTSSAWCTGFTGWRI